MQLSMNSFGPYTPVVQASDYYFISGQVGVGPDNHVSGDIAEQTEQVLKNMKTVLGSLDLKMSDVVKTTVFLKNIQDFKVVNDLYTSHFPEPRPARSCVEVSRLPEVADGELLIEIEAVAYKRPAS